MSRLRGCSPIRTGRPTPEIIYPGSAQSSFNTPPTGPVLSFAAEKVYFNQGEITPREPPASQRVY